MTVLNLGRKHEIPNCYGTSVRKTMHVVAKVSCQKDQLVENENRNFPGISGLCLHPKSVLKAGEA